MSVIFVIIATIWAGVSKAGVPCSLELYHPLSYVSLCEKQSGTEIFLEVVLVVCLMEAKQILWNPVFTYIKNHYLGRDRPHIKRKHFQKDKSDLTNFGLKIFWVVFGKGDSQQPFHGPKD